MRACIESAIDAGHITREEGDDLLRDLTRRLREGTSPGEAREAMAAELAAEAKEARRRMMIQEQRRQELTQYVLAHRNARGENDPAEALWLLAENDARARVDDIESKRLAILSGMQRDLSGMLHEFRKGAFLGDFRRSMNEGVSARLDNVVREVFGENTGDRKAKEMAQAWIEVSERARQRFNAAGGAIRKLDRWGFPQSHDAEALVHIGREAWVNYLMKSGVLDRERMVNPLTGERYGNDDLREALELVWKRITTDGFVDREPTMTQYGKGALGKRFNDHERFLHFKNADAWLDYQKQFGQGDAYMAMMLYAGRMARDIATMEVLGPNPEAMRNYLKQLVLQHAAIAQPLRQIVRDAETTIEGALGRVLDGDLGRHYLELIVDRVNLVANEQRTMRLAGGDAANDTRLLGRHIESLDAVRRALGQAEAKAPAAQRARAASRLVAIAGEIEAIQGRMAPQLNFTLSKRNRAKLDRLRAEQSRLRSDIEALDKADTSIAAREPEKLAELNRMIDELLEGEMQIDLQSGGVNAAPQVVKNPQRSARIAISRFDAMWDVIRGSRYAPVHEGWADWLQASRNLLTGALLGSAAVTSVSDVNTVRQARKLMGLKPSTLQPLVDYIRYFASEFKGEYLGKNTSIKWQAVEAGLMLDSAMHVIGQNARFIEIDGVQRGSHKTWGNFAVSATGFAADRVLTASLLNTMTQGQKHMFGLGVQSEFGKRVAVAFGDLPSLLKRTLERSGIDADAWDKIRSVELYSPHEGVQWLRPREIEQQVGRELAERYTMMIHRFTRKAVIEGTVRSRAFLGAGQPGTIQGELGRNFGQFKSFGIAVVFQHVGAIMQEWQAGNRLGAAGLATSFTVGGALLGALVNELYEIINGRDPVLPNMVANGETPGWDYWTAALLKGGGWGLYGDFLFAPVSKGGQTLSSAFIGPLGGQLDRLRTRSFSGVEEFFSDEPKGNIATNTLRTASEITPGSSLWYLRLIKERMGLNQLQLALDPNAAKTFRRQEKFQKKRLGNDYWWRPGELLPGRGPNVFGDVKVGIPELGKRPRGPGVPPVPQEPPPGFEPGRKIEQADNAKFDVIDGDTLIVNGQRWRLTGFDAPEIYKKGARLGERAAGMKAAMRLKELVSKGKAELVVIDAPDRWGRGRARLEVDGRDAADVLIGEGLAKRMKHKKKN